MFTKHEVCQINWIKDNLKTCNKWTKADYVDFYDRDIKLLLNLVEKVHASQSIPAQQDTTKCITKDIPFTINVGNGKKITLNKQRLRSQHYKF